MGKIASLVVELKADLTELVSASRESRDHLKSIEDSSKSLDLQFRSLKEQAVDVGQKMLAAFTLERAIEGIAHFTEGTLRSAVELRNLSRESETNVVTFQAMVSVVSDFGITTNELAKDISNLSQRVAGGDASATGSLRLMGMSVDELRQRRPDELFIGVVEAVNRVPDPLQRSAMAADLFGAKTGAALQRLPADFGNVVRSAQEMNVAMGSEAVDAAARFDAALDNLSKNAKALAANRFTGFVEDFASLVELANKAPKELWAALLSGGFAGASIYASGRSAADAGKPKGDIELFSPAAQAQRDMGSSLNLLNSVMTASGKELSDSQRQILEKFYDLGQLTQNYGNLVKVGFSLEQLQRFKAEQDEIVQSQARLSNELRESTRLYGELQLAGGRATDALNEKTEVWLGNMTAAVFRLKELGNEAVRSLNDRGTMAPESKFDELARQRDRAFMDIAAQEKLHPNLKTDAGVDVFGAMRAKAEADFNDAILRLGQDTRAAGDAFRIAADAGSRVSTSHYGAAAAADAFAQIARGGFTVQSSYSLNPLARQTWSDRASAMGGEVAFDSYRNPYVYIPGVNAAPPGRRAMGGPVAAGQSVWVGDGGEPELWTPDRSGTITPASRVGGGVTINVNVSGMMLSNDPSSRQQLVQAIGPAIAEAAKQMRHYRQ